MPTTAIDSKVVDKALRDELWPALKAAGFRRRTGRTAWRDRGTSVQCVSVRSFNSYLADLMGATTFSLGVNVGVFYPAIADRAAMDGFVKDRLRPMEYECHLRKVLTKSFTQPNEPRRRSSGLTAGRPALGRWTDRPDVWLILPDGSNAVTCVQDAAERIEGEGLKWLDLVSDSREAIRRLFEEPDVFDERGVILEIYGGSLGSPSRWQAIGALAAAAGDGELLRRAIDAMDGQRYWTEHPRDLEALRRELASLAS